MRDDAPEAGATPDRYERLSQTGALTSFVMVHGLGRDEAAAVHELVTAVTASRDHSPINSERLQQALDGSAAGYVGALAWSPRRTSRTARPLVGYAQAVRGPDGWDVEVVAQPGLEPRILRAVRGALAAEDDATVQLWRYQATRYDDRLALLAGFSPTREIRQLHRSLPVPSTDDGRRHEPPSSIALRPFRPGRDEEAWLDVNRRAFAWHPEQGGWTAATLAEREREPWFDPEGFLLDEVEGGLAGFCWTKVHRDTRPPLGEIYVIGVDPSWHGQGLGRALVLAGLDHLARVGMEVAMLYVEATNEPALHLYESLGFVVDHVDRVYEVV